MSNWFFKLGMMVAGVMIGTLLVFFLSPAMGATFAILIGVSVAATLARIDEALLPIRNLF